MSSKRKRQIVTTIVSVLAFLLILQLQPFVIQTRHGVNGSFGYYPRTNDCLGWVGPAKSISWLPFGELEFHLGFFNFHYLLTRDDFGLPAKMCLGQDIVFEK